MASVYRRKRSPFVWIKYRDHDGNIVRKSSGIDDEAEAQEFANNIERICKIARDHNGSIRNGALEELVRLGVIDASELLPKTPVPVKNPFSLEDLALAHPTVIHEKLHRPFDHASHLKRLKEFMAETGVTAISDLDAALLRNYFSKLVAKGMTASQLKHRLIYLKAAGAVAAERGQPNPFATFKVPRGAADRIKEGKTLSLKQVVDILNLPVGRKDGHIPTQYKVAIGLQTLMGLRTSEACRLQWVDLSGDLLHVGARDRKNEHSSRVLPVPASLLEMLSDLKVERRDWPTPLILARNKTQSGKSTDFRNLRRALDRWLPDETGNLRKSFASIAAWEIGLPPEIIETFMGHRISTLLPVTTRHYLAKAQSDRLREYSQKIDEALKAHGLGTQRVKT